MEATKRTSSTPSHVLKKRKLLRSLYAPSPSRGVKGADVVDEDEERPLKRQKISSANKLDNLPWKQVQQRAGVMGFETDGVMLMVEEVEDVDVVYEDQGDGRKKVSYKLKVWS